MAARFGSGWRFDGFWGWERPHIFHIIHKIRLHFSGKMWYSIKWYFSAFIPVGNLSRRETRKALWDHIAGIP